LSHGLLLMSFGYQGGSVGARVKAACAVPFPAAAFLGTRTKATIGSRTPWSLPELVGEGLPPLWQYFLRLLTGTGDLPPPQHVVVVKVERR
jgi:hypothetical protein